jgi:hypothetical protein
MQKLGPYCQHGNYESRCEYHGDPLTLLAADLLMLITEDHHELDYDGCTIDTEGAIETIKEALRERIT